MIFGASPKGMQMDIDQLMYTAVSKDNDRETLTNFLMSQGPRESANEHLIPEQLFDDPNTEEKEVEGVSAVKALQIAASQGQTIYTITQQNYAEVLPKLHLQASTLTDINNAMWAGHVVTVHEKTISYKGWRGEGYSIVDPNTGAGAYLINGGANGAAAFFSGAALGAMIGLFTLTITGEFTESRTMAAALAFSLAYITTTVLYLLATGKLDDGDYAMCYMGGIQAGLATVGIVGGLKGFGSVTAGKFAALFSALLLLLQITDTLSIPPSPEQCNLD